MNVEEDHLDFFKDLADIRNSFRRFAHLLPENGLLVINGEIENYHEITDCLKCRFITFSKNGVDCYGNKTDYSAEDIKYNRLGCANFNVVTNGTKREMNLKVPGEHNVVDCLAAIAVSDALGIDEEKSKAGLENFRGADRRFEYKGEMNGFTIVDDYAHHPTEIKATMTSAARIEYNKLYVVFQPHTYTRTKTFFDEFVEALSGADEVIMPDIYAARETDTLGVSSKGLCDALNKIGTKAQYIPDFEKIAKYLLENCTKGDLVITMGAGEANKIGDMMLSGKV